MKIGNAIKELRKRKGIRQNVFCKMIGLSQTSLSLIEGDVKYPRTLNKIAKTLNIPEHFIYLLSATEKDVPKNKKELFKILYPVIKDLIYSLC